MTGRDAGNNNDSPETVAPTGLEFQIIDKIIGSSCNFVNKNR